MTRRLLLGVACALPIALGACDECAGTPSCMTDPHLSYYGQVIEHRSGAAIAGTSVTFIRDSGTALAADTVRTVSDADGFFSLRVGAYGEGDVHGRLVVDGPASAPYTVPLLTLPARRGRGDGAFLGRFVTRPYLLLVGHIRDRKTLQPLPDASVTVTRDSGGALSESSATFVTDAGGQFAWYPDVIDGNSVTLTFAITAAGYPRTYRVTRTLPLLYRDGEMSFQIVPVGLGFPQYGNSGRRGFGTPIPGVTLEFRRLSGVETSPQRLTMPGPEHGAFGIPLEPLAPGTLTVELRLIPPAPLPVEVDTLTVATSDDDIPESLGFFGYGAHVYLSADLRYADTGEPVPGGTIATLKRTGGLPLLWETPAEGDARVVGPNGRLLYGAPTPDSGQVTFDIIVRLPPPLAWDTVRAVVAPARYSDVPAHLGVLAVRRRNVP